MIFWLDEWMTNVRIYLQLVSRIKALIDHKNIKDKIMFGASKFVTHYSMPMRNCNQLDLKCDKNKIVLRFLS